MGVAVREVIADWGRCDCGLEVLDLGATAERGERVLGEKEESARREESTYGCFSGHGVIFFFFNFFSFQNCSKRFY